MLPTLVVPVALGLFVLVGSTFATFRAPGAPHLDALAYALLLVGPVALVFRRAAPPVALGVTAVATLAYFVAGYAVGPVFLPLLVALAAAVVAGHRRPAYAIIGGTFVTLVVVHLVRSGFDPVVWTAAAFWLAVVGAVVGGSEGVRARRERLAQVRATRAEAERRRGSEERLRIAQELHDVLGHHVSLINVQAGVALYLVENGQDTDLDQVRESLTAIRQSSRDLLREMRATLGVLRAVDEPPPHHPMPGIDRLDALAEEVRAAGLPVRVEVEGARRDLPPSVDLAAYRIVQEALTNVRKHAGPATADVRLAYTDAGLTVQVDDDGTGATPAPDSGGDGIAGMRERATALGGSLSAGPRPGGGFRVRAQLPAGRVEA